MPSDLTLADVLAARDRIAPWLVPTPFRAYPALDAEVGHDVRLFVKHENFQPTGSFKVRNGLAFMTALDPAARAHGVVAASRGNHGLGVAWAAREFGIAATICVPVGNNPDKNAGMRALGATVVEEGRDFDEALVVAGRLCRERGATMAHSTNDAQVVAGAGTMTLEVVEQEPVLDALVLGVGGGSQAAGAITVAGGLRPAMRIYAVQAVGAAAAHDSWHARTPLTHDRADTFADGLATRAAYPYTFPVLLQGLADFVTVTDAEIADAMRVLLRTTHTLVEGAAAAGLAGVRKLAGHLHGQRVGIALTGGNVDRETLLRVLAGDL